uniref:Putative secreted protein n=1 Tax=Anopheles darlingi TaxID=43151 RepID=A0A2M4D630_ANODA
MKKKLFESLSLSATLTGTTAVGTGRKRSSDRTRDLIIRNVRAVSGSLANDKAVEAVSFCYSFCSCSDAMRCILRPRMVPRPVPVVEGSKWTPITLSLIGQRSSVTMQQRLAAAVWLQAASDRFASR